MTCAITEKISDICDGSCLRMIGYTLRCHKYAAGCILSYHHPMPHLKQKMKIGSRMMLMTAPASVETMANFGFPSARMMGFIACPNI